MPIEPEIEETTDDAPLSLRDSLNEAFETTSEPPEPRADVVTEPNEGETQEQADARARDEKGQFAKEKKVKPVVTAKPVVKPAPVVAKAAAVVKPGTVPVPTSAPIEMKAPQSFRGPAKEAWAQTPEAVRVEVLRREKEISNQLTGIAEERKWAGTMKAAFAPYEAQIRAEGSTPDQTIANLMGTAQLLRTGPAHLKAQAVAQIITTYGVPLEGLVQALSTPGAGGQPAGQPAQQQPQHVDPAAIAKQVREDLMKELGSQRDAGLVARAEAEVSTQLDGKAMHGLDGTDYSEGIRQDMADIIERGAARGLQITLDQAYGRAAREHPEVSKVLAKQARAAEATKANASTTRARAATVSVRNQPATQPVGKADSSNLRSALEAAMEQHEG